MSTHTIPNLEMANRAIDIVILWSNGHLTHILGGPVIGCMLSFVYCLVGNDENHLLQNL